MVRLRTAVICLEEKRNRRTRKKYCRAEKEIEELKQRNLDIRTAKDLLTEDLEQLRGDLQKALILKNTAQMNVSRAKGAKGRERERIFRIAGRECPNRAADRRDS